MAIQPLPKNQINHIQQHHARGRKNLRSRRNPYIREVIRPSNPHSKGRNSRHAESKENHGHGKDEAAFSVGDEEEDIADGEGEKDCYEDGGDGDVDAFGGGEAGDGYEECAVWELR